MPTPSPPPRNTPSPSSSPAARFLSGFYSPSMSPVASPLALATEPEPDAEGLEVSGFILGQEIGRGGFSLIRRGTSISTGAVVAVKIVRAPAANEEHAAERRTQLARECDLWTQMSHEHVLPLFSSYTTRRATYFITQFCPAGSLYDILRTSGKPTMDDAGMMFRQVVRGLRYLHELARVVHGDMKLENVLVDESGMCKISDFGMARPFDDVLDAVDGSALDSSSDDNSPPTPAELHSRRQTIQGLSVHLSLMRPSRHARPSMPSRVMTQSQLALARQHIQPGSLPYSAPELLMPVTRRKLSEIGHTGPGQDIWAIGVMLYVLLTGVFPFADTFEPRIRRKILAGSYDTPSGIGKAAAGVLRGCLQTDLHDRWTVRHVDEAAWTVGWDDVAHTDEPDEEPVMPTGSGSGRSSANRSRRGRNWTHPLEPLAVVRSATRPNAEPESVEYLGERTRGATCTDVLPAASQERRGRTRRRDDAIRANEEASRSRSSGPATPPDSLSPERPYSAARISTSSSSSSSSSRRVRRDDRVGQWKPAT
ncbi:kinase-like domain-containing protein [Auriculariales sp. MPI-PUGE-AT-0066]|nr:kinase-like domain-containing protein [Auriculariales sp. MPI-PUGE-AT-0066]